MSKKLMSNNWSVEKGCPNIDVQIQVPKIRTQTLAFKKRMSQNWGSKIDVPKWMSKIDVKKWMSQKCMTKTGCQTKNRCSKIDVQKWMSKNVCLKIDV